MSDTEPKEPKEPQGPADHPVARTGGEPVVLSTRRVSYWYGDVIGINEISLDIGPGVTGLLGPNGAGKSTLMKVMTGQLEPRSGEAKLHGEPIWNNAEAFRQLGLIPEQDAFWDGMTGREFVTYLTRLQGYSVERADALAADALETVGMLENADRPIDGYSKGMRQRTKFAQALAHHPEVLFMDEPLNGTDPVGRRQMIDLIRRLGDEGKTVVVSSHVLEEVEQMTSDILLIYEGRVLAEGNIYEIRELIDEHPHSIYIDCDRPREFGARLASFEDVVGLEFLDGAVKVATEDPNACYDRIPKLALNEGIELRGMTSPDNDLSAVFRYLVD